MVREMQTPDRIREGETGGDSGVEETYELTPLGWLTSRDEGASWYQMQAWALARGFNAILFDGGGGQFVQVEVDD